MKRFLRIGVLLLAVSALAMSCSKAKVIPVSKMEKIYREMLIADQWLAQSDASVKEKADTTWFYRPIFKRYGYTFDDYTKTVTRYLRDPERYSEMMDRVAKSLMDESNSIRTLGLEEFELRNQRENALSRFDLPEVFDFSSFISGSHYTDRIRIEPDYRGIYLPVEVLEDTMYKGPRMVLPDSAELNAPKVMHTIMVGDIELKSSKEEDASASTAPSDNETRAQSSGPDFSKDVNLSKPKLDLLK